MKLIEVRSRTKARSLTEFSPILVEPGGWTYRWLSAKDQKAAEERWLKRLYATSPYDKDLPDWVVNQCGGCAFFLAWDGDYGMCAGEQSPNDGKLVFEHVGCLAHSEIVPLQEEKP